MTAVAVVITVDAGVDLDSIQAKGQQLGLTSVKVLTRLGLLTGVIDDQSMSKLADIPGVRAVELERKISVWPPS
jgi:hypothetical protein